MGFDIVFHLFRKLSDKKVPLDDYRIFIQKELIKYPSPIQWKKVESSKTIYLCTYKFNVKNLDFSFYINFSNHSLVDDISIIDSTFSETLIQVCFDYWTPNYCIKLFLSVFEVFCKQFDLFIYEDFTSTCREFDYSYLLNKIISLKKKYTEKQTLSVNDYYKSFSNVLENYIKYFMNFSEFSLKMNEINVLTPKIQFFVEESSVSSFIKVSINSSFVIPPHTKYILIVSDDFVNRLYLYEDLFPLIKKYLIQAPISESTSYINQKGVKKLSKIIKKIKEVDKVVYSKEISINNIYD